MMRVKQVVFLVGGRGTRLGSVAATTPKPLLEIAQGLRFLDVLIDQAARQGFIDIILLAGHLGEQVVTLYQGRSVREATVSVVREPEPAGTGGALALAANRLDEWFLLYNGDSLFDINLRKLATGLPRGCAGHLALREVPDVSRYGSVVLDGDRVVVFEEKSGASSGAGLISGGVYLLNHEVLRHVRAPCSLEREVFPALAKTGQLKGTVFDGYFLDMGLPDTFERAKREVPGRLIRPAVFFDRDGVLNVDIGHAHRPEDLTWIPGARETILRFNEAGYFVFVTTNQSGIGRGYYSEADMMRFHARMQDELADIGAHIDAFYFCPFHEDAAIESYRIADHPDRKPNPGMILRAVREWPVDRQRSFLIGDQHTDGDAARRAGIRGFMFKGGDLKAFVEASVAQAA